MNCLNFVNKDVIQKCLQLTTGHDYISVKCIITHSHKRCSIYDHQSSLLGPIFFKLSVILTKNKGFELNIQKFIYSNAKPEEYKSFPLTGTSRWAALNLGNERPYINNRPLIKPLVWIGYRVVKESPAVFWNYSTQPASIKSQFSACTGQFLIFLWALLEFDLPR